MSEEPTYPSTKEVLDWFEFFYETYYLEDDRNLAPRTLKIKKRIEEILKEECD